MKLLQTWTLACNWLAYNIYIYTDGPIIRQTQLFLPIGEIKRVRLAVTTERFSSLDPQFSVFHASFILCLLRIYMIVSLSVNRCNSFTSTRNRLHIFPFSFLSDFKIYIFVTFNNCPQFKHVYNWRWAIPLPACALGHITLQILNSKDFSIRTYYVSFLLTCLNVWNSSY